MTDKKDTAESLLQEWVKGNSEYHLGCSECGEDATKRVSFLLENARTNPASSGYRGDDISWCSDHDEHACEEHVETVRRNPPEGMNWCGIYDGAKFPHMMKKRRTISGQDLVRLIERSEAVIARGEA